MYCNKCGYPFPAQQPRQVPQQPARQAAPAARPAPRAAKRPVKREARGGFLDFSSLITEDHLKLIYILGAALIVLVSVMGIAGMFKKPGATDKEENAAANEILIDTKAIAEYPAGSPVFWVVFLVAGNILWRMFCELFAMLSRLHGGTGPDGEDAYDDDEMEEYTDVPAAAPGGSGQMVECPKCHRIVPIEDLRECQHCGVQGCKNCIRMMGLLKKTLTCRECFEGN
jgi:hypothetical protein